MGAKTFDHIEVKSGKAETEKVSGGKRRTKISGLKGTNIHQNRRNKCNVC